jgi:hypothetical protein
MMKHPTYNEVKEHEAKRRVAGATQARKNARSAKAVQRRASLVGDGSKWQITNLRQVANVMAKWA